MIKRRVSNRRRDLIIEKIIARTIKCPKSGCWNWQGPNSGSGRGGGYGRAYLDGQTVAVHIVIFTHFHGYIPGKMQVDHLCNNRLCCNPDHLDLVDQKENHKRRRHREMIREMEARPAAKIAHHG